MARILQKRHGITVIAKGVQSSESEQTTGRKASKAHAWRVLAPYVRLSKKPKEVEDEQFSFYLKKKPAVLLRDLSSFISDSVDLPSLFNETSDVLKKVTKSSWVSLYLVDTVTNEIYQNTPNPVKERHKVKWKIEEQSLVATYVAKHKEYVLVEDILLDIRFPEGVGYTDAAIPKSVMCIPIVTPAGDCFGVIEFVRTITMKPFNEDDLKICVMVTAWMGVAIHQNQERLALKRQQELNDYLLDLIKCYFEDHVIMEKLMGEVIKFAKITLGAERGSFFILDKDSDEMVAHLFDEEGDTDGSPSKKVRFSKDRGIAGLVAQTGKTVNIRDAYKDTRFNKEIDQKTGFITRSILCMPIAGAKGVLGVVQVVNKKSGGCFTQADETLFKTFSLYCSLAMHYTDVHTQIVKQTHLNVLNMRAVRLQEVPCTHDQKFFSENTRIPMPEEFDSWYITHTDEMSVAPQYILHIITQLVDAEEIDFEIMQTFILVVKKYYRDIPYHNFEHAFNVHHCMYCILKRNQNKFTKLEVKALLIACIGHDLDHVGVTNSFLQVIQHDLAMLYDSSILENHHWQMTLRLLNEYPIFKGFTDETRATFLNEIHKAIIATDLALYFERRATLVHIIQSKTFTWSNQAHRASVKAIMMNACDLSGSCKPFLAAKKIADNLYREFYRQGDKEKIMGSCPLSVMDRDKKDHIPDDQLQFLNVVVIPCVDTLRVILPNTKDLYLLALMLRTTWQDIIATRWKKVWRQDDSIVSTYL